MYLWATVKLSPSVIGYFASSVVVGVFRAGACLPRACVGLLCGFSHLPAARPGALLETALAVSVGKAGTVSATARSVVSEERTGLVSWPAGGVARSRLPLDRSPAPPLFPPSRNCTPVQ